MIPGEVLVDPGEIELNVGRRTVQVTVANTGDRPIQIGSHFHFFETNTALRFDREVPELDSQTLSRLMAHDWPGNVRELRNVAERYALGLPAFKKNASGASQGLGFAEAVEAFERNLLSDALQRTGGNLSQASQELGMAKTTLFDKVKKYGLS